MATRYRNRSEAGQTLATYLGAYRGRQDVRVLARPRGGVPVAYEVARALDAPLDVFLVRKLGVPGHEELALGAIATGVIKKTGAASRARLERREREYRGERAAPDVRDRTVILIDDGLATGA